MQKTKVRKDKHSLYVKSGGYIFRPVITKHTKYHSIATSSQFKDGDVVKAKHMGGSPCGKIKRVDSNYFELWSSHGCYIDYDEEAKKTVFLNSEDLLEDADISPIS